MIGTGMGLWSFTFEYYANVLKAIAGDWNVDLPLPFVGDLWWLGVFSNEESGREFVFCSGAWPRAGSLAGTDVGAVRYPLPCWAFLGWALRTTVRWVRCSTKRLAPRNGFVRAVSAE